MQRLALLIIVFFVVGCSYGADRISSLVKDPDFAAYQEKMDNVESRYLHKEITYAQYLEQKKHLDDQYSKGVQHRRALAADGASDAGY
jgi:hypothetical protein